MGKRNFYFGMNIHFDGCEAYPHSTFRRNLGICKDMGINLIRYNIVPSDEAGYLRVSEVIDAVEDYGMDIMLCVDRYDWMNPDLNEEFFYNYYKDLAKRNKGRVKFYQLSNEMDCTCMFKDDGSMYCAGDGMVHGQYNPERLPKAAAFVRAAHQGVKDGDPDALTCVNFGWWHTYFLEYLRANGCEWDVTGCDWYSDQEDKSSFLDVIEWHNWKFGNKPIIICETNWYAYEGADWQQERRDARQVEFAEHILDVLYKKAPENFLGVTFYELMDEPAFEEEGTYGPEAHFGFVACNRDGSNPVPKSVCESVKNKIIELKEY